MYPPQFTHAITRLPGANFVQGLTTSNLGAPDYTRMLHQHAAYVDALRNLGLLVTVLDPLPGFPDAYFVEDTAVIVPEVAVLTRPGAAKRRGEAKAIQPVLSELSERPLEFISAPGTLDGGDVLVMPRHAFIGISARTNRIGAEQLASILAQHGYRATLVPVSAGLHLKSSINAVAQDTILVTADHSNRPELSGYAQIILDPGDEYAANTLLINDTLLIPAGFPSARQKLLQAGRSLGLALVELDVSEARKMDGGLTCMSLRYGLPAL